MENKDIRWIQRFNNYKKALARLNAAVQLSEERELTDLEQQGLIQAFEFTYEMAWKTLQDLLHEKGYEISGPNPVVKQAFQDGYIKDGELWMDMKESRDKTVHAYNEETANEIAEDIINVYHNLLVQLETRLEAERLGS